MPAFDWDAALTDSERDELIEKCARLVVTRGMTAPAILFLELHLPVGFLAGQSLILASGFLAPIFGPQRVRQMARLLESRDNVQRLIARIDALSQTPESLSHL